MALSYEYSVGSVRAKETGLLKKQDLDLLIASGSVDNMCAVLRDKGYDGDSVEDMINNRTESLWSYVRSVAPDMNELDLLLCRNDLQNIKVTIKGVLSGRDFAHMLAEPYTVEPSLIREAVEQQKFSLLPDWVAEAARQAFEKTAHESDARLGDTILDRAVSEHMLLLAEKKSDIIFEYFKTLIFYANVKTALRCSRIGAERNYIESALVPVDGADVRHMAESAAAGESELVDYLSRTDNYGCADAVAEYKKSPSAFERFADNKVLSVAVKCRYASDGIDPLFGYIIAVEAEQKVIHIIASGLKTGQNEASVRERLRKIYG